MEIGNVTVLDGNYTFDQRKPCIILDAATAQRALSDGEINEVVEAGLRALYLAGKAVVYVSQDAAP